MAEVNGQAEGSEKRLPEWPELTAEQQYVLNEARMHHRLGRYNKWLGWAFPRLEG